MFFTYLFVALVSSYTAIAAVFDFRLRRIPNFITLPAALAGLFFHTFMENGWGFLPALSGLAIGFSILLLPWMMGGSGMGDVKLLAALGAWLGPKWILISFVLSIFFAALLAICILIKSFITAGFRKSKKMLSSFDSEQNTSSTRKKARVLPFAIPVAMSTWLLLGWMVWKGTI